MRHPDPHFNSDPFIQAHDNAAEAKAKAADPSDDTTREQADEAVLADYAEKDKHIGSGNPDPELPASGNGTSKSGKTSLKDKLTSKGK